MSEIKINDESYSELGAERANQDNWAALYFEKLLSEHKSQTSEQCSKAIADSESAVTTAEAAQRDSAAAKRQAESAVATAESAQADSEYAKAASEAAQEAAAAAQAITAEARAIAAGASADVAGVAAKVGDLNKIKDGYNKTDLVSYANEIESNLKTVSEHCEKTTADSMKYVDGQLSGIAGTIPAKVSQLENDAGYLTEHQDISGKSDITYVDAELLKKQDKEPEWQLITDTTLTEDASFKQTLPDNCVGLRVKIRVPKETALSAGQLYPVSSSGTWIYTLYIPGYNADTAQDKLITAEWTQEHGTWTYDCKVRTGAGNFNGSIIYSFPEISRAMAYKYSLITYPTLDELKYDSELKAGTIIKVWGLIK